MTGEMTSRPKADAADWFRISFDVETRTAGEVGSAPAPAWRVVRPAREFPAGVGGGPQRVSRRRRLGIWRSRERLHLRLGRREHHSHARPQRAGGSTL